MKKIINIVCGILAILIICGVIGGIVYLCRDTDEPAVDEPSGDNPSEDDHSGEDEWQIILNEEGIAF